MVRDRDRAGPGPLVEWYRGHFLADRYQSRTNRNRHFRPNFYLWHKDQLRRDLRILTKNNFIKLKKNLAQISELFD